MGRKFRNWEFFHFSNVSKYQENENACLSLFVALPAAIPAIVHKSTLFQNMQLNWVDKNNPISFDSLFLLFQGIFLLTLPPLVFRKVLRRKEAIFNIPIRFELSQAHPKIVIGLVHAQTYKLIQARGNICPGSLEPFSLWSIICDGYRCEPRARRKRAPMDPTPPQNPSTPPEQTWDLSKKFHDQIFRQKLLHTKSV